jgi:hypothetical protein
MWLMTSHESVAFVVIVAFGFIMAWWGMAA